MRIRSRKSVRADVLSSAPDQPQAAGSAAPAAPAEAPARAAFPKRRPGIAAAALCVALAGAAVAAFGGPAAASPASASASAQSASAANSGSANDEPTLFVGPCTASDVSFYYGGVNQGLGSVSFDVTIAAHDGIACSLSDIPAITVTGPASQAAIPLGFGGRGATLVLRPNSPLHTTLGFSAPDTPTDGLQASYLHLAFADGTSQAAYFLVPGGEQVSSGGIFITAWTTGLGGGEGDGSD